MIPLPPLPHLEVLPGAPRPRGHPLVRSDGAPFGHPWTRVSVGATGSGLEVSVSGSPEGPADAWKRWRCRLFAPWETLTPGQPPPAPGSTHRGNLYRIARGGETRFEALSPTGRTPPDFHVPARFARFTFPALL